MFIKLSNVKTLKTLLTLLIPICLLGQQAETAIENLFSQKNDIPGCAVAVFSKGQIIYQKGFGLANQDYDIHITPETVFEIASVSKQFTAACMNLLRQQGELKFEDPVKTYLPELPDYKEGIITIYDLLHQTSGLKDYLDYIYPIGKTYDDHFTEDKALKILSGLRELNFEPRTQFEYSNSNYLLQAIIIRRVSGMSIGEFAKKYIFDPLEMKDTFIYDDASMNIKNRAIGYRPTEKGYVRNHHFGFAIGGDGQVHTTVEDFFKWNENFKSGIVGREKFFEEMTTKGILKNGDSINYALGLRVSEFQGLKTVSHTGEWGGSRAHYLQFPDDDLSIVILSNRNDFPIDSKPYQIAELLLENKLKPVVVSNSKSTIRFKFKKTPVKKLKQFEGFYWNPNRVYSRIIRVVNDTLRFLRRETDIDGYNILTTKKGELILNENGSYYPIKIIQEEGVKYLRIFNGGSLVNEFENYLPKAYSQVELDAFIGKYYSKDLDVTYHIQISPNGLIIYLNGIKYTQLESVMKNLFKADVRGVFEFVENESRKITGFKFRDIVFEKE